jgi:hypothetical protein
MILAFVFMVMVITMLLMLMLMVHFLALHLRFLRSIRSFFSSLALVSLPLSCSWGGFTLHYSIAFTCICLWLFGLDILFLPLRFDLSSMNSSWIK